MWCVTFHNETVPWSEAVEFCGERETVFDDEAKLISDDTSQIHSFLERKMSELGLTSAWIGGHDVGEDTWHWAADYAPLGMMMLTEPTECLSKFFFFNLENISYIKQIVPLYECVIVCFLGSFTNWLADPTTDCAVILPNALVQYKWLSVPCTQTREFLCQRGKTAYIIKLISLQGNIYNKIEILISFMTGMALELYHFICI